MWEGNCDKAKTHIKYTCDGGIEAMARAQRSRKIP
jgi:hypothetical protein